METYNQQLERQGGGCAVCRRRPTEQSRKKYLCIDHDHETGAFRGLLCDACNRALGLFGDSPETLEVAASYLRAPPVPVVGSDSVQYARGENHGGSKLTAEAVLDARRRYAAGESVTAMARALGVAHGTLGPAVRGSTWKHL